MATKINRKFVLVVTGFAVAAALLLGGVIFVYQVYVKDAERNIVKGDELMAEGKLREAYGSYGRAVSKKPGEIRYVEKMEEALRKIVADTNTAAREDYGQLLGIMRARTRARPLDPEQWRLLLEMLEEQAAVMGRAEAYGDVIDVAKEMKSTVPADAPGAELADIYIAYGMANRTATLSSRERADLVKQLQALAAKRPTEWRIWRGLFNIQAAEVEAAANAGQAQEAAQRMKALDETLAAATAALASADPSGKSALAQLQLRRLLEGARRGRRFNLAEVDPLKLTAAVDAVAAAALAGTNGDMLRDAAALIASSNKPREALAMLESWIATHPDDLRSRATVVLLLSQLAQYNPDDLAALRTAAKSLLAAPQQSTSLNASMQEGLRATAISSLLNAELARIADEKDTAKRDAALAEVTALRTELLKSAQNDETNPAVLAADAKIAQVKGDIPGAQRKWDTYFTKVVQPSPDVYLWAALAARQRNDLSLALQYARKGLELNSDDFPLAILRADLADQLGFRAEATAILEDLSRMFPENPQIKAAFERSKARLESTRTGSEAPKDLTAIENAVKAGRCEEARALATQYAAAHPEGVVGEFVRARVELSCGDSAKAIEIADAGLVKQPNSMDLWRLKAEAMTSDPIERVEILVKGVVPDPRRQAAELLTALRSMRTDLNRREQALRGPDPKGADEVKKQIDALNARIARAEQDAGATAADDPSVIESNFADAVVEFQRAQADGRQQDAQAAFGRAAAQLEAARKLAANPELPIIIESTLLELQGKVPDALALVEKARAAGQTEARLAVRLAQLQERLGNEPAALRAWQEAYDRRANDTNVVLGYVRAMGRAGKGPEVLNIIRASGEANPTDPRIQLLLAQFETTYGSRARAIEVREELARRLQPIPENLAGLYSLLNMAPSIDAVKGSDGQPLSSAQWSAMSVEQRGRLLSDAARDFQARAEKIYSDAMAANPLDIGLAVQKARVMREQGRFAEGTAAIQAVVDAAKARGPVPAGMYLDLGMHLLNSNEEAAADKAFEEARKAQDPKRREADLVLVEIDVRRGRLKQAADELEAYLKENPRIEQQVRLCELLNNAGELDRAEAALQRATSMAGSTPSVPVRSTLAMLKGMIENARAEQAERAGKLDEANALRNKAIASLGEAEALQPNVYVPALRRIGVLRQQAKSGGRLDTATLQLAIAEADKLLARNAALYDAAQLRAALELDKGDLQGAIGVLDRYLVAQPQDDGARSRLIALYRELGNRTKAVDLARTAADAAPYRADWREILGDLQADSGDHAGAAAAFERAFQIQPQVYLLLAKAIDERVAAGNPQAGLAFLQAAAPDAQVNPVVRASQAAALAKLGRAAESTAVAKEAIAGARAAGINSSAMQLVMPRLRKLYPADKMQEFEDLMVSTGTPNAAEMVLLGGLWGDMGAQYADKAIKWADATLALGNSVPVPLQAVAHTLRGNALYLKGDVPAAEKEFFRAAELEPNTPSALNNAAFISAEAGTDLARSLDFAERAVALVPERSEFVDTLGYVLLLQAQKSGDPKLFQRAEEVLKRSLQLRPSAAANLHLGMLQAATGREAEARKSFDAASKSADVTPDLKKKIDAAAAALK